MIICWVVLTAGAQTLIADIQQTNPQAEWTVTLAIEGGSIDYAAMMLDVELASHSIANVATTDETAEYALRTASVTPAHNDGTAHECMRITAYSPSGATFATNGTPLLTITVTPQGGEAMLPVGDYDLFVQNIVLADFDGNEATLDPAQFVITSSMSVTDAITSVTEAEDDRNVYDLTGRKVRANRGLYIQGGKKVICRGAER